MKELNTFLTGKRILLLGFGREGESSYWFLRKLGVPSGLIGIADKNPVSPPEPGISAHLGAQYLESAKEYDLILRSPGIPLSDEFADQHQEQLSSQVDLFLRFAPGIHVGVTGTKGKSSTSALMAEVMRGGERAVQLLGNIGVPVLDGFEECSGETISVLELSSHQLQFLRSSPPVAVFLNLYPDHLDYYGSPERYFDAKCNIFRWQDASGVLLYGEGYSALESRIAQHHRGQTVPLTGSFQHALPLPDQNVLAAVETAGIFKIPDAKIQEGLSRFQPLKNRLEPIRLGHNRILYNDSAASVPEATISALTRLKEVSVLIVGGMDRGSEYAELVEVITAKQPKLVIGLPDTGREIISALRSSKIPTQYEEDLPQAVSAALASLPPGEVCLFSPAAPSYHRYRNFEERGEHLRRLLQSC